MAPPQERVGRGKEEKSETKGSTLHRVDRIVQ